MPNWVKNILSVSGQAEDLSTFITDIASMDDAFDFGRLIPMPDDLQIESGSSGQHGLEYLYLQESDPAEKEHIDQVYHSINPFFGDIRASDRTTRPNTRDATGSIDV